jgi:hypothetical protein
MGCAEEKASAVTATKNDVANKSHATVFILETTPNMMVLVLVSEGIQFRIDFPKVPPLSKRFFFYFGEEDGVRCVKMLQYDRVAGAMLLSMISASQQELLFVGLVEQNAHHFS